MAKAKKQEKPIEQRLEEALVLYEKTPYELPSNWCWTRLGTVCKLDNGIKNDREELFYLDAKTLRTQNYEQTRRNGVVVEEGEKVILVDGENSGEVFDIPKRGYMGSTFRILNINKLVNEVYVRYFISSHQDELRNNKIGSAIPHLNKELFFNLIFPLAPLEEQKRIVEIIEKQFAKLDEARDLIQKSLDSFADRKFAILHKAFTGELTKQWRENNSVIQRKNTVNFLDCIEDMQNGISKRNGKEGKDFIVLRLADLKENRISTDDNRTIKLTETEIKKYQLKENDIIMIRVNGSKEYVGRQILFNMECACAYCDHIIRIQYRKDISPKFMLYFSQTREYKDYILQNLVSSAGQNTISRKGLSRLKLNLPLFEEQEEIVRILDSIFEKEDKSKELIDILDKIDEMKKSILARAFCGELGTSNPTDEPATDLLRKILEQNN